MSVRPFTFTTVPTSVKLAAHAVRPSYRDGRTLPGAQAFTSSEAGMEPLQEPTGLPLPTLQWVGRSIASVPPAFHLHPEVERLLEVRKCVYPQHCHGVYLSYSSRGLRAGVLHLLCRLICRWGWLDHR